MPQKNLDLRSVPEMVDTRSMKVEKCHVADSDSSIECVPPSLKAIETEGDEAGNDIYCGDTLRGSEGVRQRLVGKNPSEAFATAKTEEEEDDVESSLPKKRILCYRVSRCSKKKAKTAC